MQIRDPRPFFIRTLEIINALFVKESVRERDTDSVRRGFPSLSAGAYFMFLHDGFINNKMKLPVSVSLIADLHPNEAICGRHMAVVVCHGI